MSDRRLANCNWKPADEAGNAPTWERVNTAVLLDIRDELQKLNALLHCGNFIQMPSVQRQIRDALCVPNKITKKQAARALALAGARKRRRKP